MNSGGKYQTLLEEAWNGKGAAFGSAACEFFIIFIIISNYRRIQLF